MSWLFYALLAPLVFTVVNFIDKLILEKHVHNPFSMPPYIAIMAFISGCLLFVVTGFPFPPLHDVAIVVFTGVLVSVGALLYYQALSMEETSKVIVLIQIQPVMVLILSFLLLHETISSLQFVGFVLILGAAIALSVKRGMGGIQFSNVFWMLLIVNFIWSLSVVLFKFVASGDHFEQFLAYESWGFALGGLLIFLFVRSVRNAFRENLRTIPKQALATIAVNETIFLGAKLLTLAAVALGPTALVSVLGGTQVFFGIVAGWILTVFVPAIYKEQIGRNDLIRKGAIALILFAGIACINISL
ncbi:MAG: EamA family transporter [Anaerolineaceae bacterium]|nr:EamA family transporter [Anaerolineaceae bacterium]